MLAPLSDGGAGFVDVLHASLGGELIAVTVTDACGQRVPGSVLRVAGTAYVESSQAFAAERPLTGAAAETLTSQGVGMLVRAAVDTGASRVVVGIGPGGGAARQYGVAPNDGGAGLLAALGAAADPPTALAGGVHDVAELVGLDLSAVLAACAGVDLVLATDDDSPLLGLLGTTNVAGAARGIDADRIPAVDKIFERLATIAGHRQALTRGAGAGGGIGYGLLLAGAAREPGLATVAEEIHLAAAMARADLVVTGEAALDFSGGSGVLSSAVAARAGSAVRPCIALAGRVAVGAREMRALGIESAYGIEDGRGAVATGDLAAVLATLAERVARTWSWSS